MKVSVSEFTNLIDIYEYIFSLDKNTKTLSSHPSKEHISEFITKCTSTAEESLLPNLFDWNSDSCWTSENPKGIVRV